ncbi:MAG: LptA/OstA family protein [Acetobacteraceae bacterium]|nr:LptA/OstA family protein [Acetobacteraceae bacterium]
MKRVLAALLLLAPSPALAQGIDLSGGGPVDITAQDGIEWRQQEQVVVARGNARAVRDAVTVDGQRLLARYRPQGAPPGTPAGGARQAAPAQPGETPLSGGNEIWRLEAEGAVRIATQTDTATGDRAVYDMDQAVLVLTGRDLSLTTPQQRITARDSLEYWSQRRMAVARGNALVVTQDGRRITADTLVAYMRPDEAPAPGAVRAASVQPRPGTQGAATPPPGQGRLDRIELFGNVEIRTETEVVRADRGVYSAETGRARLLDNVRITRGDNQVNGREAVVDLNTGVSRLVSGPNERVRGLIMPGQQQPGQQQPAQQPQRGQGTPR